MLINITKISAIVRKNVTDKLLLYTEMPSGCWPFEGKATLRLEVASGTAEDYCSKHFPDVPFQKIEE
jgi:hypothetical protein